MGLCRSRGIRGCRGGGPRHGIHVANAAAARCATSHAGLDGTAPGVANHDELQPPNARHDGPEPSNQVSSKFACGHYQFAILLLLLYESASISHGSEGIRWWLPEVQCNFNIMQEWQVVDTAGLNASDQMPRHAHQMATLFAPVLMPATVICVTLTMQDSTLSIHMLLSDPGLAYGLQKGAVQVLCCVTPASGCIAISTASCCIQKSVYLISLPHVTNTCQLHGPCC